MMKKAPKNGFNKLLKIGDCLVTRHPLLTAKRAAGVDGGGGGGGGEGGGEEEDGATRKTEHAELKL